MVITLALSSLLYVIKHTSMTALFIHPTQALELAPLLAGTTLRIMVIVPHFLARSAAKTAAVEAAARLSKSLAPNVVVLTYDDLLARAKLLRPIRPRPNEELATLSCTSGSTVRIAMAQMRRLTSIFYPRRVNQSYA